MRNPATITTAARQGAFTLVELLIVVAIIAILAAIAVPNFHEATVRSKVSRSRADMRALATAVEAYAVDYQGYPLNGVLNVDGTWQNPHLTPAGAPAHKFPGQSLTTPVAYITAIPADPFVPENAWTLQAWNDFYPRYFYTNLDWFAQIMKPATVPAIVQKRKLYGIWILAGAGPDRDRLDLAADLPYDPTNGAVSNGDLIRSHHFAQY